MLPTCTHPLPPIPRVCTCKGHVFSDQRPCREGLINKTLLLAPDPERVRQISRNLQIHGTLLSSAIPATNIASHDNGAVTASLEKVLFHRAPADLADESQRIPAVCDKAAANDLDVLAVVDRYCCPLSMPWGKLSPGQEKSEKKVQHLHLNPREKGKGRQIDV